MNGWAATTVEVLQKWFKKWKEVGYVSSLFMQHQQPNPQLIWLACAWIAGVKCARLGWSAASEKPVSCRMWPTRRWKASEICQVLIKCCRRTQLGLRFRFRQASENRKPLCRRETFRSVRHSEREHASHHRSPKCYWTIFRLRLTEKKVSKQVTEMILCYLCLKQCTHNLTSRKDHRGHYFKHLSKIPTSKTFSNLIQIERKRYNVYSHEGLNRTKHFLSVWADL